MAPAAPDRQLRGVQIQSLRDEHIQRTTTSHEGGTASAVTRRTRASSLDRRAPAQVPPTTLVLVVPTRNEAANVERFVERVGAALAPFPIDWHAEMIDESDDDTPSIVRRLARGGAPVQVTHQEGTAIGGGLGGAIRMGLKRATGDVVCVIDADLQHPPEILPALVAPIVLGRADICVGSRYRRGGSAAGLESPWRRLAARGAGVAVRWLLPATRLASDPGSGLFAMRREMLDSVDLRATGPRVLAEILARARWRTICDVPYRFTVTDEGNTELGIADGVAAARELIALWRWRPWIAALRNGRNWHRPVDPDLVRRRVAPVHVELLRGPGVGGPPSQADRG